MHPGVRWVLTGGSVATMIIACGSSGGGGGFGSSSSSSGGNASSSSGATSSGGSSSGSSSGATSSSGSSSSGGSSSGGSSSGGVDAGPPWSGVFTGPLTCSGTGSYLNDFSGTCGVDRWSVKTGTDSAASQINMTPQLTTVASLLAIPSITTTTSTPRQTSEMQTWALKNAYLNFVRLEEDGDYHMVLSDALAISGGNLTGPTLIGEIPFPGCFSGGPLACNISRARATVDGKYTLVVDQGHDEAQVVSVIGVSFFDFEHGQFGSAPNNIELHAVVAICFGEGCDPTKT